MPDPAPDSPPPTGGVATWKIVAAAIGGVTLASCCGVGGCVALSLRDAERDRGKLQRNLDRVAEAAADPDAVDPITADLFFTAYAADESAADERFEYEVLRVVGTVALVGTENDAGTVYVALSNGGPPGGPAVRCLFDAADDGHAGRAAELSPGREVTIVGLCMGKGRDVTLWHCRLAE